MQRTGRSPSPNSRQIKKVRRPQSPHSSPVRLTSSSTMTMKPITTIGTHSGSFHLDEALAIAMLKELSEFKEAKVYRSRDQVFLDGLDVLVDVGNVYDPATLRFDHHQRSFQDSFNAESTIRLSSAGLIYKHYGLDVLKTIVSRQHPTFFIGVPEQLQVDTLNILSQDPSSWEVVYQKVYDSFIQAADAIDNGILQYPVDQLPAYRSSTALENRVARLNPSWINDFYHSAERKAELAQEQKNNQESIEQFHIAMEMCREEFYAAVRDVVLNWMHGRELVQIAISRRFEVHPSGQVIALDKFCPWKSHLFEAIKEEVTRTGSSSLNDILFAIFPSGDSWRYVAVPLTEASFAIKPSFPQTWLGLRGAALDSASGLQDMEFIHNTGFTGGAKTKKAMFDFLDVLIKYNSEQDQDQKK